MNHDVELKLKKHPTRVEPYIDGKRVPFCKEIQCGEKSIILKPFDDYVVFACNTDVDLSEYVDASIIILKDELLKHTELYNGFLASIGSAIRDSEINAETEILSERILRRVIGEE